jgi:hypothetical protein
VTEASWLDFGNLGDLLETYYSFSPELKELCRMAEDLKLWSLASRSPPSTLIKGKLALVVDAAHPTLPRKSTIHFRPVSSIRGRMPLTGSPEAPEVKRRTPAQLNTVPMAPAAGSGLNKYQDNLLSLCVILSSVNRKYILARGHGCRSGDHC